MKKFIDVRNIIAQKNAYLLKWIPGFIIRYVQKILHEQNVNEFIEEHKHLNSFEFCEAVINKFNIELEAVGLENVPDEGPCVLAVNHPLGGMDAMAIVTLLQNKRRDIKFIVNDVLLNLENLKEIFVGVDKIGKNQKESLRKVDELFGTDQLICVFPSGLVSRKNKGKVEDLEWKKTFVTRSKRYNNTIIPVHINGELSNFFYRLANLRKAIGLKVNIEMLYLVNELYKQDNKKMRVIFGSPLPATYFDKSKSDKDWAQEVKKKVYALEKQYDK